MKDIIDKIVSEIVDELKLEIGDKLESIMLFGSYTQGKISLERPNVNMLIITKENVSGDEYLKIGRIFYKVAENYKNYFSIKIDSLPFRFGFSENSNKTELVLSPNISSITEKNQIPAFGIPHNVLDGIKKSRKVAFGSDSLSEIDTKYTKEQLIQWALFDVGLLFRNQLIRAPLSYDIDKNLNQFVNESLQIGKMALFWGAEIFIDEAGFKSGKYMELINNKEKMIEFYQNIDRGLVDAAKIILEARQHFQEYKTNREKAFELYNAAYVAVTKVFLKILSEMKK